MGGSNSVSEENEARRAREYDMTMRNIEAEKSRRQAEVNHAIEVRMAEFENEKQRIDFDTTMARQRLELNTRILEVELEQEVARERLKNEMLKKDLDAQNRGQERMNNQRLAAFRQQEELEDREKSKEVALATKPLEEKRLGYENRQKSKQ